MQTNTQLPTTPWMYNPKVKGPRSAIHPELGRCSCQRWLVAQFGFSLYWGMLAKLLMGPCTQACFHGFAELRFVQAPHCLAVISFSLSYSFSEAWEILGVASRTNPMIFMPLAMRSLTDGSVVPQLVYNLPNCFTTYVSGHNSYSYCNLKFALEWWQMMGWIHNTHIVVLVLMASYGVVSFWMLVLRLASLQGTPSAPVTTRVNFFLSRIMFPMILSVKIPRVEFSEDSRRGITVFITILMQVFGSSER